MEFNLVRDERVWDPSMGFLRTQTESKVSNHRFP
jgi:hypothetical protein